jgi:hypothetical protein
MKTMSATSQSQEFDRNFKPRERHFAMPRIALRQRSADHPMVMFFVIVATAFAAAAFVSPSGTAFASLNTTAPLAGHASLTASRLATPEADVACRGQAWGAESEPCLEVIAKEAGKARKIRLIAADESQTTAPTIF